MLTKRINQNDALTSNRNRAPQTNQANRLMSEIGYAQLKMVDQQLQNRLNLRRADTVYRFDPRVHMALSKEDI